MNDFRPHPGAYWQSPWGMDPNWHQNGTQHPPGQRFPGTAPFHAAPLPYTPGQPTQPAPHPNLLANPRFIKGALVGAAAAYLLSNEAVQQNAIKAAVSAWSMLQGGIEEMKERFRDAEAELHAEAHDED